MAEEIDVFALLEGVEPKDYERVLMEHGIYDFRAILRHLEMMKQSAQEEETVTVSYSKLLPVWRSGGGARDNKELEL